jgi:oxygen-independent coproporphyrinogen III oxidase
VRPCGLYVHVPFCLRKCGYCSFHSTVPASGETERFGRALLAEMERRVRGAAVSTLYAGGGTPTLMPPGFWAEFMGRLRSLADLSRLREATIETNPAATARPRLEELREAGFDRLSIGVQSFLPAELETLGRIHTAQQAMETLRAARAAGFSNIGLDLIYGIPGQTMQSWRESLNIAGSLAPEHISCYQLSLERGTPMFARVSRGELSQPSEDLCAEMYFVADRLLAASGYLHYEISNYALGDTAAALHNSSYWDRSPYIGLGPSAHGFDGSRLRSWNTPETGKYMTAIEAGRLPDGDREELTPHDAALEMLMLGLRMSAGVDLEAVRALPGVEIDLSYASQMVRGGKATFDGRKLLPTPLGMFFADGDTAMLLRD